MATEITWYSSAAVIHTVYFTWILHTRFSLTNHQLIVREEIKMWEVYDRLIETVPADLTVSECMIGMHWTLIRSTVSEIFRSVERRKLEDEKTASRLVGSLNS
jgi:hypothetical protein